MQLSLPHLLNSITYNLKPCQGNTRTRQQKSPSQAETEQLVQVLMTFFQWLGLEVLESDPAWGALGFAVPVDSTNCSSIECKGL